MHIFADLRARAHSRPGIHHGAFIDIRANVHVARHQNCTLGNVAAAPCHSGRNHADTSFAHFGFAQVAELGFDLVKKAQLARPHEFVVVQFEAQQHGFFNPLVYRPLTHALAAGHANAAVVELGDGVVYRVAYVLRRRLGGQVGPVVPSGVNQGFELCVVCGHEIFSVAGLDKLNDSLRGFNAFRRLRHQRHSDAAFAWVVAVKVARQVATWQNHHIVGSEQVT